MNLFCGACLTGCVIPTFHPDVLFGNGDVRRLDSMQLRHRQVAAGAAVAQEGVVAVNGVAAKRGKSDVMPSSRRKRGAATAHQAKVGDRRMHGCVSSLLLAYRFVCVHVCLTV